MILHVQAYKQIPHPPKKLQGSSPATNTLFIIDQEKKINMHPTMQQLDSVILSATIKHHSLGQILDIIINAQWY